MKNLKKILVAILISLFAFAFVSCGEEEEGQQEPKELGAITISLDGNTLSWSPVQNATSFVIYNGVDQVATVSGLSYDLTELALAEGEYTLFVSAKAEGYKSSISNSVTYTVEAKFAPEKLDAIVAKNNNDLVMFEEVVVAVVEKGFFVASAEGAVYVNANTFTGTLPVVGDKVQVKAKFGYANNYPQIKAVESLTIVSHNNPVVQYTEASLKEIAEADYRVKTNYSRLVKLVGNLSLSGANYVLKSDEGDAQVEFSTLASLDSLAAFADKRVEVEVIVHKFETEKWTVAYFGGLLQEKAISSEDVGRLVEAHLKGKVPTDLYEALNVPANHNTIKDITYTWTASNDAITFDGNTALFKTVSEDTPVEVKLEARFGEIVYYMTFNVVSHPVVPQTVEEFRANSANIPDDSRVKLHGIVVSWTRNQSGTIFGLILASGTDSLQIDFYEESDAYSHGAIAFTDDAFKGIKLGDDVTITGQYRCAAGDRKTIEYPTEVIINSSNNPLPINIEGAYALEDQASYKYFAEHYDDFSGRLVKFVNPWMSGSSKSSLGNYIRMGYAQGECTGNYSDVETRYYGMLVDNCKLNCGTAWIDLFKFPASGSEKLYDGYTLYCYVTYTGNSVLMFTLYSVEAIVGPVESMAKLQFIDLMSEVGEEIDPGELELPATIGGETISWSSESQLVSFIGNVATFSNPTEYTEVELKASFTFKGESVELVHKVTVKASVKKAINVSEMKSLEADSKVYVQGVVAGITRDQNATIYLVLKDAFTNDLVTIGGMYDASNVKDSAFTIGGLVAGDTIALDGKVVNSNVITYTSEVENMTDLKVEIEGAVLSINTADQNITSITTQAELVDFGTNSANQYKIAKLSDVKAIYYAASQGTVERFFITATQLSEQKLDGTHSPVFWKELTNLVFPGLIGGTIFATPSKSYGEPEVAGQDLYVMFIPTSSSSYFQCALLGTNEFVAQAQLKNSLKEFGEEVDPGDYTFPEAICGKAVTWTSVSELVTVKGGTVTFDNPTEYTPVELKASFEFGGVTVELTHTVTVKSAVKVAINVSDLKNETTGSKVYVQGVIVGITRDTNAPIYIVLKDAFTNEFVTIGGMYSASGIKDDAFTMAGLTAGDTIAIDAIVESANVIQYASDVTDKTELKVTIEGAVLNFDTKDESIGTLSTQSDLATFCLDSSNEYKLTKLENVKAIYYGGASQGTLYRFFFEATQLSEQKIGEKGLSPVFWCDLTNSCYPSLLGTTVFTGKSTKYAECEQFMGDLYVVMIHATSSTYYQFAIVGYVPAN